MNIQIINGCVVAYHGLTTAGTDPVDAIYPARRTVHCNPVIEVFIGWQFDDLSQVDA